MDTKSDDLPVGKSRSLTLTPDNQNLDYHISDEHAKKRETEKQLYNNNLPKTQFIANKISDPESEELCTGERIEDDMFRVNTLSDYSENKKEETGEETRETDTETCSERRRQFSMLHSTGSINFHSVDSMSSELSSHSRHSVTSFLQARECDAEDILSNLGFGCEYRMSVPDRFLVNSSSKGMSLYSMNMDDDDDDIFDTNSTSYSSSWSDRNQIFERIPSRFATSISSSGSNTDLSDYENEKQKTTLPLIIEPEQSEEDSFDLMRHLRLNRIPDKEHHQGRILLEPVTEELEVSSVGSGSVRTRISNTQQDSLDSIGNASVLTKISRKQESEDSSKEQKLVAISSNSYQGHHPRGQNIEHEQPTEKHKSIENDNDQEHSESGISSAYDQESLTSSVPGLRLPVLRTLALQTKQDSFELEEIATSDENLDKMESEKAAKKESNGKMRSFKRENSDESSGFEDDTQYKKRSTESPNVPVDAVKISLLENSLKPSCSNNHQTTLLVPFGCSTPKNDAECRRSAFSIRHSWSTSKQKRVAFEDEHRSLGVKSRSYDHQRYPSHTLDTHSYSLDVPLAQSSEELAETLTSSNKDATSPEKRAIDNIRKFMSTLMSIRRKFKKTVLHDQIVSAADESPKRLATTGIPSTNVTATVIPSTVSLTATSIPSNSFATSSIPSTISLSTTGIPKTISFNATGIPSTISLATTGIPSTTTVQRADGTHVLGHALEQAQGIRKESGGPSTFSREAYQSRCLEELDSFEEDLQKYRNTFTAMEMTSTIQETYYSTKLLTRFAWDIITIRRLRSRIKQELATMQTCLTNRRLFVSEIPDSSLPFGITDQMKCLLSMQLSLKNYLLKLAENVPRCKTTANKSSLSITTVKRSEMQVTLEDMANEIKDSVFQDVSQMFQEQINNLRKELKEKDDVIDQLRIKVERIENDSTNPKLVH